MSVGNDEKMSRVVWVEVYSGDEQFVMVHT